MAWVFGTVTVTLGIVFLWGLVAPRNQWRTLASWSVADPYSNEPGGAAYALRRLFSGLGLLGIVIVAAAGAAPIVIDRLTHESRDRAPVELMWGTPAPLLVDRVIYASTTPPTTFASMPVLGYQDLDEVDTLPAYLLELRHFSLLGDPDTPGYIGSEPEDGFSAVGQADLLIHTGGPLLCIPRDLVVIEGETTVQIGVFYGLPDPVGEGQPTPDSVAGCPADASLTGSVLIPVQLGSPVGDRTVETLDGTEIGAVEIVE